LLSIGTITISNETISLLNVQVLEIRINAYSKLEQGILDQRVVELKASTTKITKFNVKPNISLEYKVYVKTYYHHNQVDIEMDETPSRIQVQNFQIASWILTKK
jgi:hypothetical protein